MKRDRKLLCLLWLIIGMTNAQAQNLTIGATGNIGLSKVATNLPFSNDTKVKYTLSGNLGMFLEKKISAKSSIGMEALWVQMEGKEVTNKRELRGENGELIGEISDKSTLHSSYVGIPLYYRYALGKIGIKGGFQPMLFLFASSNYEANGTINNEPYHGESKTKNIKFDRLDIGPKVGLDYQLNNAIRLRADYYYGLVNISSSGFPWERKNRQITLGIQYVFYSE